MTKALKTLLIGPLYTQKHWEMFCGGRRITFKNSRKNLDRFLDSLGFQKHLVEPLDAYQGWLGAI